MKIDLETLAPRQRVIYEAAQQLTLKGEEQTIQNITSIVEPGAHGDDYVPAYNRTKSTIGTLKKKGLWPAKVSSSQRASRVKELLAHVPTAVLEATEPAKVSDRYAQQTSRVKELLAHLPPRVVREEAEPTEDAFAARAFGRHVLELFTMLSPQAQSTMWEPVKALVDVANKS